MIRVRCEKCGQVYPRGAGHRCPIDPPANDDEKGIEDPPLPFDEKEWRRHYMRAYMKRRREREKNRPKDALAG